MHILIILLGISCIIVSIYLILKIGDKESNIYNDILLKHQEIIEYSNILDEIVNNLEDLLEKRSIPLLPSNVEKKIRWCYRVYNSGTGVKLAAMTMGAMYFFKGDSFGVSMATGLYVMGDAIERGNVSSVHGELVAEVNKK